MPDPVRITKTKSEVTLLGLQFAHPRTSYLNSGETIQDVRVWEASSAVGITSVTNTGSECFFYVGSGIVNAIYTVDIAAVTTGARQVIRSFQLEIVESRWAI